MIFLFALGLGHGTAKTSSSFPVVPLDLGVEYPSVGVDGGTVSVDDDDSEGRLDTDADTGKSR